LSHDNPYQLSLGRISLHVLFSYRPSLVAGGTDLMLHYVKNLLYHLPLLIFDLALDVDSKLLLSHPSRLEHHINFLVEILFLLEGLLDLENKLFAYRA
jgi:hypothetical protein